MFLVEHHNGTMITERETTWKDLSDKVPLKMVLLCNNGIVVGLTDMDEYWFSNQAVAAHGHEGKLVAQILGGKRGSNVIELIQSVNTGIAGMYSENKSNITTDHKNGRLTDEDSALRDGIFSRLLRRFQ